MLSQRLITCISQTKNQNQKIIFQSTATTTKQNGRALHFSCRPIGGDTNTVLYIAGQPILVYQSINQSINLYLLKFAIK